MMSTQLRKLPKRATRKAQRISRRAPQWLVSTTGRGARVTVLGRMSTPLGVLLLVRQDRRLMNGS